MSDVLIFGSNGQMERLVGPRGTTPPCPEARFAANDMVRVRNRRHLGILRGKLCVVAVAIPPGFSPDWALADLRGAPRPLMYEVGRRTITYLVGFENDKRPWLMREIDLLPSGLPPGEVMIERDDDATAARSVP